MNPQIQQLLTQWFERYKGLEWYVKGEYQKQVQHQQQGWEKYEMFNGYALAAIAWYRATIANQNASPKQIMHELRKTVKQLQEGTNV